MCIAAGGPPASQPSPGQVTASGLVLGTSDIQKNQANVLGRLALTSKRAPSANPSATPSTPVPAGTLGAAPGATPGRPPDGTARSPFSLGYPDKP